MKNKMTKFRNLTIIIIMAYVLYYIVSILMLLDTERGKVAILKDKNTKLEVKVGTKSRIEIIQSKIKESNYKKHINNNKVDEALSSLARAEKLKRSEQLYNRCLRTEAQLELEGFEPILKCMPFLNYETGIYSDSAYLELERFSTRNINSTKIELGLY